MNKITRIRIGVDGIKRSLKDIISNLVGKIEKDIRENLTDMMDVLDPDDVVVARFIRIKLHDLLTADVADLKKWTEFFDKKCSNKFKVKEDNHWKETSLTKALLDAFNFGKYRTSVLVEVAKQLNLKTCPYCNMHYTLYADEPKKRSVKKLAKFQFDHFYDKLSYPMLSMSFYNLIPSCGVCNQGKSTGQLAIEYNPYYSDIHKLFHFELTDPLGPYISSRVKDEVEVELIPEIGVNNQDFDMYEKMFHLKALYRRHGDIIQEVFDKAYEAPYYLNPANFSFLSGDAPEYIERLWLGNYTKPEEIEKRPMAKFMQDMWRQAKYDKPYDKISSI